MDSFHLVGSRYATIIRRSMAKGNTAAAGAAVASAAEVIDRTAAARLQRIQELCDNFVSRAAKMPGSYELIREVTSAASAAMAQVRLAAADAVQHIQAVRFA